LAVVKDVMQVLELERIQHSIIGNTEKRGISGGQRKRVNIGMEMVADPSLLFLDGGWVVLWMCVPFLTSIFPKSLTHDTITNFQPISLPMLTPLSPIPTTIIN
jgi:hypothetical protein